jgi:hypothetical protein
VRPRDISEGLHLNVHGLLAEAKRAPATATVVMAFALPARASPKQGTLSRQATHTQ